MQYVNGCFLFYFLPNQRHGDNMGKTNAPPQLFFTIGKISIVYNKKKAHGVDL
jgi:hypothetical protein